MLSHAVPKVLRLQVDGRHNNCFPGPRQQQVCAPVELSPRSSGAGVWLIEGLSMLGRAYWKIFHVKDSSWRIQKCHTVSALDTQHFRHSRGLRGKWEPLQRGHTTNFHVKDSSRCR